MLTEIQIEKQTITDLPMSYAISMLHTLKGDFGVCASEGQGGCRIYPLDELTPVETVWENGGGCMSISQIAPDGTFLAVQNFFKGFNASTGRLVKTSPCPDGSWKTEPFMDFPYLHRFDVAEVEGRKFLIACTLCKHKDFREDWSQPGTVYIGELPSGVLPPVKMEPLIPSLTKNHGFYRGMRNGRSVFLVAGMEGLFEVPIPAHADETWTYTRLLDREISDATVVDLDGDGTEEIITIEGFHGDHITVNRLVDGEWKAVYRYPAPFAHVVWGGDILGKKSLLLAYRNDNGALMLFRKPDRKEGWSMEHLVIDELVSPTNMMVYSRPDCCQIDCSCGKTQQVIRYTLTKH